MPLSIYNLFKASLLVLNALAVLHEGRFLKHYRLDSAAASGAVDLGVPGAEEPGAARMQVAGLWHPDGWFTRGRCRFTWPTPFRVTSATRSFRPGRSRGADMR